MKAWLKEYEPVILLVLMTVLWIAGGLLRRI